MDGWGGLRCGTPAGLRCGTPGGLGGGAPGGLGGGAPGGLWRRAPCGLGGGIPGCLRCCAPGCLRCCAPGCLRCCAPGGLWGGTPGRLRSAIRRRWSASGRPRFGSRFGWFIDFRHWHVPSCRRPICGYAGQEELDLPLGLRRDPRRLRCAQIRNVSSHRPMRRSQAKHGLGVVRPSEPWASSRSLTAIRSLR
jgi:hypothetical protein